MTMKAKRLVVLVAAAMLLGGCERRPVPPAVPATMMTAGGRFTVVQEGRFETSDYYHHEIVTITDNQTGKEYICVQGFGSPMQVAERHGKTTSTHDR